MARVKRRLFVFGKEVIRIAIQHHFAYPLNRHQRLGDQLGRVEQIKIKLELVLLWDQLQPQLVLGEIACFNGLPQIAAMKIGVAAGELLRLIPHQRGFTRHRFPVEADKGSFACSVNQAEGVDAEAFHGTVAAGNTAIGHGPHNVVQGLWL